MRLRHGGAATAYGTIDAEPELKLTCRLNGTLL
jgi:hypothetical protein